MSAAKLLLATTTLGMAGIVPALAGPLGPDTVAPTGVTAAQKATTVNSQTQNQLNATSYFVLPAIGQIIQQSLRGTPAPRQGANAGDPSAVTHLGMAAGDAPWPLQVWLQGNAGSSANSLTVGGYNLANYGTQLGIQAQITPTLLVGVSGSWQGAGGTLNGGFTSTNSSFGVAPYVGWQFSEHWNLSAIAGYTGGQTWTANAGSTYNANYQSSQWNVQGAVTGSYTVGDVRLSPAVSLLYLSMNNYTYTDSTGATVAGGWTALTRGAAGGSASLPLNGWEPYIRAGLEHDFAVPTGSGPNGNTGGTVGAGTTLAFSQSMWASVDAGYNSIGRTGLSLWSASARLNLRF